jgi:hypothetical protein
MFTCSLKLAFYFKVITKKYFWSNIICKGVLDFHSPMKKFYWYEGASDLLLSNLIMFNDSLWSTEMYVFCLAKIYSHLSIKLIKVHIYSGRFPPLEIS